MQKGMQKHSIGLFNDVGILLLKYLTDEMPRENININTQPLVETPFIYITHLYNVSKSINPLVFWLSPVGLLL